MRLVLSGVAVERLGRRSSVDVAGLEGRIGLVDDLQLLLGGLVAAMGVRVMLLDQHLVARLEAQRGERRFEIEHREGLLASRGGTRRGVPRVPTGVSIGMAICAAPVLLPGVVLAGIEAEWIANAGGRAVALAKFPAR